MKSFGRFLALIAITATSIVALTSCGKSGSPVTAIPTNGSAPQSPDSSPGVSQQPGTLVSPTDGGTVVFLGKDILSQGLFTLSAGAQGSSPVRIDLGDQNILEVQATAIPHVIAAIMGSAYGSQSSVDLINLATGEIQSVYQSSSASLSHLASGSSSRWAAFQETPLGNTQSRIKIISFDQNQVTSVPLDPSAPGSDQAPQASADGKGLYFERVSQSGTKVLSVTISDPNLKVMQVADEGDSAWVQWRASPDGKEIAYVDQAGILSILINASGVHTPITTAPVRAHEPRWSANGKNLLYWTETLASASLRLYAIQTQKNQMLSGFVPPASGKVCPAFSFSGDEVYYTRSSSSTGSTISEVSPTTGQSDDLTDSDLMTSYFCALEIR